MHDRDGLSAPHRSIRASDERERLAIELFDGLWSRYRGRVSYARTYESIVEKAGAAFVNDHIAFRTCATQRPAQGIASISRVFEALGYAAAGCYAFPDKHLGSLHYRHPNPKFPKLFISELKTWELPAGARRIVLRTMKSHRPPLPDSALASLREPRGRAALLAPLLRFFSELPWNVPQKEDVEALDKDSQFGAWVLVHGYDVNHFTASVNSHGVSSLSNIDKTVAALKAAGVPMKAEIEGARGSALRQSATEAVLIDVPVREGRKRARMPWTYAYFELAERRRGFDGFLGGQATQLFEMTRRR